MRSPYRKFRTFLVQAIAQCQALLVILGDKYHSEMISKNVSTIFGNSDAKPAINGMRDMTRSLVNALENLTLRHDLKFLSCLTWKGIIPVYDHAKISLAQFLSQDFQALSAILFRNLEVNYRL